MDALHMNSKEIPNNQICDILNICNNTLLSFYKMYNAGGVDELRRLNFYRPQSQLLEHKESLEKYFMENPPASISEAVAKIKQLTGIERKETQVRKFLKSNGFRCLRVGIVPTKAMTEGKKTNKRNTWTKNFNLD
jgi:transposase